MSLERFLSIHIPRTGGTELQNFFIQRYGIEKVYFYYEANGGLYRTSVSKDERETLTRQHPALYFVKRILITTPWGTEIYNRLRQLQTQPKSYNLVSFPADFSVVHGHFMADHFKQSVTDAHLVTVLREPLERTISHYCYWRQLLINGLESYVPNWFTLDMGFEQFALLPPMINLHAAYIGNHKLIDFTYVGVQEDLREYCDHFDPDRQIALGTSNKSVRQEVCLSSQFVTLFQQAHAQDYELYREASAIAGRTKNVFHV